jgi:hypothetical protein
MPMATIDPNRGADQIRRLLLREEGALAPAASPSIGRRLYGRRGQRTCGATID